MWFGPATPITRLTRVLLQPAAWVVASVARGRRRQIWQAKSRSLSQPGIPVIVVGNLLAGGTGKTPVILALAEALRARGHRPGLLARGYRGEGTVHTVATEDGAGRVGDEALLLARRSGLPVVVGTDRAAALAELERQGVCDVVLSDDGLQHLALRRDLELVVLDERGLGNGRCLPAGPLREPAEALEGFDAALMRQDWGGNPDRELPGGWEHTRLPARRARFHLEPAGLRDLLHGDLHDPASLGGSKLALAGIGRPERFFATLARMGLDCPSVALPDHARIDPGWLAQQPADWILMTEKDAVKCEGAGFDPALRARCLALRVQARLEEGLIDWLGRWLDDRLENCPRGQPTA